MTTEFEINDETGLRIWRFSGAVDPDEVIAQIATNSANPDIPQDFPLLIILSEDIDLHKVDLAAIRTIQDASVKFNLRQFGAEAAKIAVICSAQMQQIVATLLTGTGREEYGFKEEINVFTDANETGTWLEKDLSNLPVPGYARPPKT